VARCIFLRRRRPFSDWAFRGCELNAISLQGKYGARMHLSTHVFIGERPKTPLTWEYMVRKQDSSPRLYVKAFFHLSEENRQWATSRGSVHQIMRKDGSSNR
jgi:hypothetical protein